MTQEEKIAEVMELVDELALQSVDYDGTTYSREKVFEVRRRLRSKLRELIKDE